MAYAILPINSWQDIDFPIIVRTTGVGIPTLETLVTGITAPQWQVGDTNLFHAANPRSMRHGRF